MAITQNGPEMAQSARELAPCLIMCSCDILWLELARWVQLRDSHKPKKIPEMWIDFLVETEKTAWGSNESLVK